MTGHEIGYDPISDQMLIMPGFVSFTNSANNPTSVATQVFESGGYQYSIDQRLKARYGHRIVFDRAHNVLTMLGGVDPTRNGIDIPNPNMDWVGQSWQPAPYNWQYLPLGNSQALQGAAYDEANARMLIVSSGTVLARVGTSWSSISPRNATLQNRIFVDSAFDQRRGRFVLYGGVNSQNGQRPSETWEWDGAAWTLVPTVLNPGPREDARMIYDERTQRVLLFGGYDGTTVKGDLWSWDGSTWTLVANTPSIARGQCAIAWDSRNQRIVIQGGFVVSGSTLTAIGDSWEWDGTAWLPGRLGSGPSSIVAATYDVQGRRIVVIGGIGGRETWYFNGTWTRGPDTPGTRSVYAIAHDAERNEIVLTGGLGSGTWVLANGVWSIVVPTAIDPVSRISANTIAFDPIRRRVVSLQSITANSTVELVWTGQQWVTSPVTGIVGTSDAWMVTNWASGRLWHCRSTITGLDVREFDGAQWSQISGNLPFVASRAGFFYDAAREQIVAMELSTFAGAPMAGARQAAWNGTTWADLGTSTSEPLGVGVPDLARRRNVTFGSQLFATRPQVPLGTYPLTARPCLAGDVQLSITNLSGTAVTFEWRRSDTNLAISDGVTPTGTVIQGSSTATLRLLGVNGSDLTSYYCRVAGPCGPTITRDIRVLADRCIADTNCDGATTVSDLFDFVNLWFASAAIADVDGTAGIQTADLLAFLNAWFASCDN